MSGTVEYVCDGCHTVAATAWRSGREYRRLSAEITRREVTMPSIRSLAPEGWVVVDPYTCATYCPTCWVSIVGAERAEET